MKTSIRNKLTALILAVCLTIIGVIWFVTTVLFRPMYHTMTQAELSNVLTRTLKVLDKSDGTLNQQVYEEISTHIKYGVCIEISDINGEGLVLMEGIGDACQLHGGKDNSGADNIYMDQRRLNTPKALQVRSRVRESVNYNTTLTDDYANKQVIRGRLWDDRYTVVASTNLARTDSVVRIVSSQLSSITFFVILFALIISALLSNWFISPIMALSKATKEISKGNYNVKIVSPEGKKDEFGQLARDFNKMAKEIESAQEMQKELIAGISHDLRTPLTIIKGYAESIRDITGENPQIREQQLNTIIDETDRLSKMVNSVMEYAKLSQGAIKLSKVQYNMADMCMDVADIYSHKAESEGKTVSYSGPELVYVVADATMIERVMHNFVSNAMIHTPTQTDVKITLNVLENGKVRVAVRDSGEGISEEDQKHLFEKYYRSRKSSGKEGTGLGLAVVKMVMEAHGFEYGVQSELGKGSEFWFIM